MELQLSIELLKLKKEAYLNAPQWGTAAFRLLHIRNFMLNDC